ncbi:MAG: glycosyltransferase family 2 protein, partial [Chitinophagaceae bacterium]
MASFTSSLCIATYNWPEALQVCFRSLLRQTVQPDEILIADDGSKLQTQQAIEAFRKMAPIPVHHVWQPDEGFQLAKIRNKAFSQAKGDYILQIDGDLLLHPAFIQDHLQRARQGTFVSGTRALLSPGLSRQLLISDLIRYPAFWQGGWSKKFNALSSPPLSALAYSLERGAHRYRYVLGCNMAFWRSDLVRVNGYDERFSGWGKEDNDIALRLMNAGLKIRFLK